MVVATAKSTRFPPLIRTSLRSIGGVLSRDLLALVVVVLDERFGVGNFHFLPCMIYFVVLFRSVNRSSFPCVSIMIESIWSWLFLLRQIALGYTHLEQGERERGKGGHG
jgi:hypothetical protein